jgi:hypothetical protein
MENQKPVKLMEIFPLPPGKKAFTRAEMLEFELKEDFINTLCDQLKLDFDEIASESNVCLANSREVRAEFRTSFNKSDIINLIAVKHPERKKFFRDTEVLIPGDAISFWAEIYERRD